MAFQIKTLALGAGCVLSLSGCAGMIDRMQGLDNQPEGMRKEDWQELQSQIKTAGNSVDDVNMVLAQGYTRVLRICISTANWHERRAKYGEVTKLTIGTVGAISAGIVGPTLAAANAAKSAIAAWGAVGGVTSGMLSSYDNSGVSPRNGVTAKNAIIHTVANTSGQSFLVTSVSDAPDRLTKLAMLHFNCKQPATELAQQDLEKFNTLVAAIAAGHTGDPAPAPDGKLGGAAPPKPSPAPAPVPNPSPVPGPSPSPSPVPAPAANPAPAPAPNPEHKTPPEPDPTLQPEKHD